MSSRTLKNNIINYSKKYSGSWSWPFGQNCHYFQNGLLDSNNLRVSQAVEIFFHHLQVHHILFLKHFNMLYKILFLLFWISFFSCSNNQKQKMRVEYYKGWTSYSHPVKLIDKIDSSQVTNLRAYYAAKFEDDKLVSVTKYLNGTIVYEFKYEYDSKGNFKGEK